MANLVKIDELTLLQHRSLTPADHCFYLFEYTARQGHSHSRGNRLIINLKKPMEWQGRPDWKYKLGAINEIASELQVPLLTVVDFSSSTVVPIPPSKIHTNAQYDDRLTQILKRACPVDADIQELIIAKADMDAAHEKSERRPSISEILNNYALNSAVSPIVKDNIVIFDDVITAGNHYVASRQFMEKHFPGRKIMGIFVARRVLPGVS